MIYTSTRNSKVSTNFTEVIKNGLPSDGGLYIPKNIPKIKTKKKSFLEILIEVFKNFMSKKEYKFFDIEKICKKTYTKKNFPLGEISIDKIYKNLYILRISNGRSFSFKDIAISLISKIFGKFFKEKKILCATSGDTGSSCIEFFKKTNIKTFVFSPFNRTSKFQSYQMYSSMEKNIFNLAIDDNFDKCQFFLKKKLLSGKYNTVNSINWVRIIIQASYYIYCCNNKKKGIKFVIPTGNFGNAYSAYIAKKTGARIKKIIITTNENDVLFNFFNYGIYDQRRLSVKTNTPSMDISKASNLERIIYSIFKNQKKVLKLYKEKIFKIKKKKIKKYIICFKITEKERNETIKNLFINKKILIDPHTSNGLAIIKRGLIGNFVVTETAKPIKFYENIKKILFGYNFKKFILPKYKNIIKIYNKKLKFYKFKSKDYIKINNFIEINSFSY